MYLKPHQFCNKGKFDEICIDFTPLGYYQFLTIPIKQYIFQEDIIKESFGSKGKDFFESLFEVKDFRNRGLLIERFLLDRMQVFKHDFLEQALHFIYASSGNLHVNELRAKLKSSDKKLLRTFKRAFDLTPKAFIRMVKFRQSLYLLSTRKHLNLTDIAYYSGYFDQSHFIKEFQFFTGNCPKTVRKKVRKIEDQVIVTIQS